MSDLIEPVKPRVSRLKINVPRQVNPASNSENPESTGITNTQSSGLQLTTEPEVPSSQAYTASDLKGKSIEELKALCTRSGIKTRASTQAGLIKALTGQSSTKPSRAPSPDRASTASGDGQQPKKSTARKSKTPIQASTNRVFKVPVNKIHKVDTGIDTNQKSSLSPVERWIKETHDYLYGQENKVGDKAMNDIMCLIFLRIIQDKITDTEESGKYDLLNIEKYIKGGDPSVSQCSVRMQKDDTTGTELKRDFTRFIRLEWKDCETGVVRLRDEKCLIKRFGRFLTVHPQTKSIFKVENFLHCQKATTITGLLDRVNEFVKEHVEKLKHEDLIGEIYEYFINQYHKAGNKLGQFFTPRKMMMSILKFKENDIRDNLAKFTAENEDTPINVWDPCMGTGGWLVSSVNMFGTHHDGKQTFNINPAGNDVETDTLRMGIMNVMNVKQNIQLERFSEQNSLTNIVDNWIIDGVSVPNDMHLITTNPPFGASGKDDIVDSDAVSSGKKGKISSLEYEYKQAKSKTVSMGAKLSAEYNTLDFSKVYKLNDKNMPIQFMEMCIHRLKEGGQCAIVLPYGELFFSSGYKTARDHFMSKVDITDVFIYPSGVFTHTGIKSCCVFFRKDSNGTKAIKFYKSNQECSEFTEITTLTRADINQDPYSSWYLNDYLEDMYIRELMGKIDCEWVAFGDVFDLVKGTLQSSKVEEDPDGEYPFINKSEDESKWQKLKTYNYDGENVFMYLTSNTTKIGVKYYNGKCSCSDIVYRLNKVSPTNINMKYIYFYIHELKSHIETSYFKGACNQTLDEKNFLTKFKIPLPSAEIQLRVVDYYDECDQSIKVYNDGIACFNRCMKATTYMNLLCYGSECEVKSIGELCTFINGKTHNAGDGKSSGLYPLYTSSNKVDKYMDTNDYEDGEYLIIGDGGAANINYNNSGFAVSNHCYVLQTNSECFAKYMYYYIKSNLDGLQQLYRGIGMANINRVNLESFKIMVPPIEIQKRIIEENDLLENSIKNTEFMRSKHEELRKDKFHILLSKNYNQMVHGDPE
jgi:type I restriction-modification system DNA methylase subunit/restriction endonuclease S subunit